MNAFSLTVYGFAVFVLLIKYGVVISIQGRHRLQSRRFAYPEDAVHWNGEVAETEAEPILRAAKVLRNDAENQPFFFVLGALYVALGLSPEGAGVYFGLYVLSRVVHTVFLLNPRQPHRNRAFSLGTLTLLALAIHVLVGSVHLSTADASSRDSTMRAARTSISEERGLQ